MMTKQQVAAGRRLLLERYMELDPTGDAVILLSGGVDSTTILFAALECGFKPQCLTFHVKQWRSKDLAAAKKLSSWFRVPLEIVELPNTIDGVITDCYRMIDECIDWWYVKRLKPTMFQVVHPFLYLLPPAGRRVVLSGSGGDILAITSREASFAYRRMGDPYGTALRALYPIEHRNEVHVRAMARKQGSQFEEFFVSNKIFNWARGITVADYNSPKQKWGHVVPFLDYWKMGAFYRRNSPYQINSGLRELHALLSKTEHNHGGSSLASPVTAYKRMIDSRGISLPGGYWKNREAIRDIETAKISLSAGSIRVEAE